MKKNVFEQFDNHDENIKVIEKAEIFSTLKNYNNPVMFKKTGKEIKEHIKNVIIPYLVEKTDDTKSKIDTYLAGVSVLPTKPCYVKLEMTEDEFPYKLYSWEETNYVEKSVDSVGSIFKGFGDIDVTDADESVEVKINPYYPTSKEEAEGRCKYNCLVEDFRDLIMDMKTANVLIKNLENNQEYWLNLDQLTALKFGEEK